MAKFEIISEAEAMEIVGGAKKMYHCPWNDYNSTNYWKTYSHAVRCAYDHGMFDIPFVMIKAGLRLGGIM